MTHGNDPKAFFTEYVLPAIEDWKHQPTSIRLATLALCELDNLSEHWLRHEHGLRYGEPLMKQQVAPKRDELCRDHLFLALARDVHDTHKHGCLNRPNALIKQGQKATVGDGGASGELAYGEAPGENLEIKTDEGATYDVSAVISDCRSFFGRALGL